VVLDNYSFSLNLFQNLPISFVTGGANMKALLEIYLSDISRIAFLSSGMTESICRQNAWCFVHKSENDGERELKSGRIVDVADELVAIWDGDDLSAINTARATLKLVNGILHCKATSDAPSDDLVSTWNASDAAADYEDRKKLETEKRNLLIKSLKKMYEDTEARGYYGPIAGSL